MQFQMERPIKTNVEFLSAKDAIKHIPTGAIMFVGGFGTTGVPDYLLQAVIDNPDIRDLTIISNNITPGTNSDILFQQGRLKKAIGSFYTLNKPIVQAYREGKIEIELLPQGTLAEAIRLGGSGIPAFFTPTAVGTDLAKGKETRVIKGREYILENSLTADVALIKAYKADKAGNIVYRKSARNFNPSMAMAAELTIVQVEEIVEIGELNPESIVTPFAFVDFIVKKEDA